MPQTWHRRFVANESGVSAVEFALIVPVILLLLVGMVDINEALTVHRKLRQVSSTASDLVAQRGEITLAEANLAINGAASMLSPYDDTNLNIVLSVLNVTETDQTVSWSLAYQATPEVTGAAASFPVPEVIAEPGIQTVAVRVDYAFSTMFSDLLEPVLGRNGYQMQDTMYERPRIGDTIQLK